MFKFLECVRRCGFLERSFKREHDGAGFTFVRVGFEIACTVCFLRHTALASTVLLAPNFFDAVVVT